MDRYGHFTFEKEGIGDKEERVARKYWYQISLEFPIQNRNAQVQENKVTVQVLWKSRESTT